MATHKYMLRKETRHNYTNRETTTTRLSLELLEKRELMAVVVQCDDGRGDAIVVDLQTAESADAAEPPLSIDEAELRRVESSTSVMSEDEAVHWAEQAYHATIADRLSDGWTVVDVREDDGFYDNGFRAIILSGETDSRIVVAFAGTDFGDFFGDWLTNATQALGFVPEQYEMADRLVAEIKAQNPQKTVVVVGHSLGGGLAAYAAARNKVHGVGINSAPLNDNLVATAPHKDDINFVHYVDDDDVVSSLPGTLIGTICEHHNPRSCLEFIDNHRIIAFDTSTPKTCRLSS